MALTKQPESEPPKKRLFTDVSAHPTRSSVPSGSTLQGIASYVAPT